MPPFGPISRRKLIRALRNAGFEGPYAGSDHEVMVRAFVKIKIPNPHRGDIGTNLLREVLKEAGVSRQEWERL